MREVQQISLASLAKNSIPKSAVHNKRKRSQPPFWNVIRLRYQGRYHLGPRGKEKAWRSRSKVKWKGPSSFHRNLIILQSLCLDVALRYESRLARSDARYNMSCSCHWLFLNGIKKPIDWAVLGGTGVPRSTCHVPTSDFRRLITVISKHRAQS